MRSANSASHSTCPRSARRRLGLAASRPLPFLGSSPFPNADLPATAPEAKGIRQQSTGVQRTSSLCVACVMQNRVRRARASAACGYGSHPVNPHGLTTAVWMDSANAGSALNKSPDRIDALVRLIQEHGDRSSAPQECVRGRAVERPLRTPNARRFVDVVREDVNVAHDSPNMHGHWCCVRRVSWS